LAVHTAPLPTAIPDGKAPATPVFTSRFVLASMLARTEFPKTTHTEPASTAIPPELEVLNVVTSIVLTS
jgi:hypothetical protein